MHLAIDASNIRQGGGVTHLSQLLAHVDPAAHELRRVTLWGSAKTLDALPERPWLDKLSAPALDGALPSRLAWQQLRLPQALKARRCSLLFSPGGTLPWRCPVPVVTMSQNMLPFEPEQARLFGPWHPMRLKMALLRRSQGRAFRRANGLIFLSRYAQNELRRKLDLDSQRTALIPHGIEERFFQPLRPARTLAQCSFEAPFRFLYVSIQMPYKHQLEVAQAAANLLQQGIPVSVDFVGPPWGKYGEMLDRQVRQLDQGRGLLRLSGALPFEQLHLRYREADAFVFASSCENLPNILIEAMAAGLPIASSELGPMPEVLEDAGLYFRPDSPASIERAMITLAGDIDLRMQLAQHAQDRARAYSWQRCAYDSFAFLRQVAQRERQ